MEPSFVACLPCTTGTGQVGSAVFRFADAYNYQQTIRAADANVFVTSPGKFEAELIRIDLHRLWMQRSHESLPRVMRATIMTSRNAIMSSRGITNR
jgi:hypothetical protein